MPDLGPLPCGRHSCVGPVCKNFNDPSAKFGMADLPRGCKGGKFPPWSWAKWYNETFGKKEERT